jgi:hypothetical protein
MANKTIAKGARSFFIVYSWVDIENRFQNNKTTSSSQE